MMQDPIVIVAATRTAMGGLQGVFASETAPQLGSTVIKAAVEQSGLTATDIEAAIMGCVLPAGQGQAPARQAALGAGLSLNTVCTTVNKMCGSGMQAVMYAHDLIVAGSHHIVVAGGMESMSNAPYLLSKARSGYRLGHAQLIDHMFLDGLEDAYDKGRLMGAFAEETAAHFKISRQAQDAFAIESLTRAKQAVADGTFADEITPHTVKSRTGETQIASDEQPGKANVDKIPQLKPAFAKDGTVTAANSSSISDGAAALVLMRRSVAEQRGLIPLAQIVSHSAYAHEPNWFTTAPVHAIKQVLAKANWQLKDVDLFEINEAFAVVTMVAMQELAIPAEKTNIHGGACALGHPIGASGARILVTLINALRKKHLKRGVASLCIGGGEATAMAIELLN